MDLIWPEIKRNTPSPPPLPTEKKTPTKEPSTNINSNTLYFKHDYRLNGQEISVY